MRPKCTGRKRGFLFSILAAAAMAGLVAFPAFGDDSDIFKIQATPNVLLILDDSGSMARTYGGSEVGDLDGENRADYGGSGTEVSSRVDVAYRVLYQLLNRDKTEVTIGATNYAYPTQEDHVLPDGSGTYGYQFNQNLDSAGDENALRFRLGLMIYGKSGSWNGYDRISAPVQINGTDSNLPPFTTTYRSFWSSIKDNYTPGNNPTPLARSIQAARTHYFPTAATGDGASCRKKFVVVITDGEDTTANGGSGGVPSYYSGTYGALAGFDPNGVTNVGQIARNTETILQAKLLADNDISLFVVGVGMLGDLPHQRVLRQVMRRTAEQQGTDLSASEYGSVAATGDDTALGAGKVFFADNADDLLVAMQNAFATIITQSRSFTAPVVPAVRTTDNNRLYQASFLPDNPPETFWEGHLLSIALHDNGALTSPLVVHWDAGNRLTSSNRNYGSNPRNVYTASLSGTWTQQDFSTANSWLTDSVLGVPSSERDGLIDDIVLRETRTMRMGDIFHSNPVVVGSPNAFYSDAGFSTALCPSGSCNSFIKEHQHRQRVIYAGGNDGMLHAYDAGVWQTSTTSYNNGTGEELFGYIPNVLLDDLNKMKVTSTSSHPYLVDGSPTVADMWLDENGDNAILSSEWKTVLISGLRKGGRGMFALDVTTPPNRSNPTSGQITANGYTKPLWEITDTDIPTLGYTWSKPVVGKVLLDDNGVTKTRWVAFVGGGYATPPTLTVNSAANAPTIFVTSTEGFPSSGTIQIGNDVAIYTGKTDISLTGIPTSGGKDTRLIFDHTAGETLTSPLGRGFYVIDILLGKVLWRLEATTDPNMGYPFPSNPVGVDSDSDGYVNYVYNVDTGGQLWRFDFQAKGTYDSSSKTVTANWSGKRIFAPSSPPAEPFFSGLDVAVDSTLNRWIYFGSGDREDPLGTGTGILYAIQDKNPNSPYDDANLEDFSGLLLDADQTTFDTMAKTKNGWFMNMPNNNEKILAQPVVFNDQLFFTSFEPTMNLCGGGGVARLYGLRLNLRAAAGTSAAVGAGVLDVTGLSGKQRALIVQGGGIASNPVISMSQNQGAVLYIGTTNSSLQAIKVDSPSAFKKLKSWKEWIAQ